MIYLYTGTMYLEFIYYTYYVQIYIQLTESLYKFGRMKSES